MALTSDEMRSKSRGFVSAKQRCSSSPLKYHMPSRCASGTKTCKVCCAKRLLELPLSRAAVSGGAARVTNAP